MTSEVIRLGDVATYINGYAFKPGDWSDVGLPIIRIQDLTGTSYQLNYYDGEYPKNIEINDGDVLIYKFSAGILRQLPLAISPEILNKIVGK